jgi:UDP-N-acetylmuramoyl-L-alanyl-D-glutamate--2,6-diaminopimelate ligase
MTAPFEPVEALLARLGVPVDTLVNDSRRVAPGVVFVAYPGETRDGRDFIRDAVAHHADGVLWDAEGFVWPAELQVPNVGVPDLRARLGEITDHVYGQPSRALLTFGVTGTNGKTSVTHWIAQALTALGKKTAVLGTVGNGFPGHLSPAKNTTPDAIELHQRLSAYRRDGAVAAALEVSSHGLDQGRVNGTHFDVAVLTNLSRDHLDYHGDMDSYAAAKARLFDWPGLRACVVNADDAFGQKLEADIHRARVAAYGFTRGAVVCDKLTLRADGMTLALNTDWGRAEMRAALIGRFNAANLMAALTALLVADVPLADAVGALAQVSAPPGRMQTLGGGAHPLVVIDYAHTPDALEKVLATLREVAGGGRLVCVFGCGGNRDAGKRPLMGRVAELDADVLWPTSDNPRDEDPAAILADIVGGMAGGIKAARPHVEPDRARAIFEAIGDAHQGDVVLIAGKGHEDYQEIKGERLPFSDVAVARKALAAWR